MNTWLTLIRPRHWIKNFLVFTPLIFSLHFSAAYLQPALVVFGVFCLAASGIYVFNDIFDIERDRQHPEKKHRPIASGQLSLPVAWGICLVLLALSLFLAYQFAPAALLPLLLYLLLNALYSLYLKHLLILDVMIIAIGFVLRILAGGFAVNITLSHWIILCTFFISLFLGFGKRKNENLLLQEGSRHHRKVLEHYTPDFLNQLLGVTAAMSVLCYALYTIDPHTIENFGTDKLFYTLPFVVYGVFRYFHLMYNQAGGGDPTRIFLRDFPTISTVVLWLATFISIIKFS